MNYELLLLVKGNKVWGVKVWGLSAGRVTAQVQHQKKENMNQFEATGADLNPIENLFWEGLFYSPIIAVVVVCLPCLQ